MCENVTFILHTFNDDWTFWKSWKLYKVKFWPKPNMQNIALRKALNLKLTQLTYFISLLKIVEMFWSCRKKQELWRRLGQVVTKTLFVQTILDKICNQSRKSSKIRHQRKNSDICFCMFFDCYWWSLISGRETGHWAMSPPKFAIFPIFPNFLRS